MKFKVGDKVFVPASYPEQDGRSLITGLIVEILEVDERDIAFPYKAGTSEERSWWFREDDLVFNDPGINLLKPKPLKIDGKEWF